jgi:hypothetical protein
MRAEATFFDTFNARFLDAEQVAATFVSSRHFEELSGSYHSLLIGPRGSGKTTLLKMLQPRAMATWNDNQASWYRSRIDYTGVFIPADISWGAQLESLGHGTLTEKNHSVLSIAAFTTHVLKALIESILSRVSPHKRGAAFRRVKLSTSDESDVVRQVSATWRLRPEISSFIALKQALSRRLVDIGALGNRGSLMPQNHFSEHIASIEYLHLDALKAAAAGIEVFNDAANESHEKWALMFDEIEIAPPWIQDELMRSFRSVDQKILVKLAISPVSSCARLLLSNELSPAGRDDLREVQLWHAEKQNYYKFCRDLWASQLHQRGLPPLEPERVLGHSYFDPEDDPLLTRGDPYGESGLWAKRFVSLAEKDKSFKTYLDEHHIRADALSSSTPTIRDQVVRKIAPLVAVREYFRAADGGAQQMRSRKTETIYAGADSLFAVTEGNPRWFIGITNPLLAGLEADSLEVSPPAQASEMEAASTRFLSMLRTIPVSERVPSFSDSPLTELLERIGNFYFEKIVLDAFSSDPPLSFIVDSDVSAPIERLLQIALNRGAIVYVPEKGGKLALPNLRGHRFRLCYLLASKFRLPLRLGKHVNLSTILSPRYPQSGELFQ